MLATLTHYEGKPVARIFDPPYYMSLQELWDFMLLYRNDDPDFYAELVAVYVALYKYAGRTNEISKK